MSRESLFVMIFGVVALGLGVHSALKTERALAEVSEKYDIGNSPLIPHIFGRSPDPDGAAEASEKLESGDKGMIPHIFGRSPARAGVAEPGDRVGAASLSTSDIRVMSDHPFIIEVQGTPHLLARVSPRFRGDTVRLQPLSGGAPVWERPLKGGNKKYSTALYYDELDGLALIAEGFQIAAVTVETGEERWSAALSDEVEAIGRRDGDLVVRTKDEQDRRINPASGAVTPATLGPAEGERLRDDSRLRSYVDRIYDHIMPLDGLAIELFLCGPGHRRPDFGDLDRLPCSDTHGLLFATRRPGTSLPFLVGYDTTTQVERWRRPLLSPEDPVETSSEEPSVARIGDDVVVAYGEFAPRILRVGLEDGSLRWEKRLPGDARFGVFVTHTGGLLLVKDDGALRSLDPESGELRGCIGRCDE
ncbi:MAG: PQQ-binding-like beta-propeller repeat protein [Myxococcales bacterium]|nr:PQQ-binding-like beta-propeller repeat protein [Myxococcales bacterium]